MGTNEIINNSIKRMKTTLRLDYLPPEVEVIYLDLLETFLITSSVDGSSSESFQDESEFESVW
jgi:hypothetical protein